MNLGRANLPVPEAPVVTRGARRLSESRLPKYGVWRSPRSVRQRGHRVDVCGLGSVRRRRYRIPIQSRNERSNAAGAIGSPVVWNLSRRPRLDLAR